MGLQCAMGHTDAEGIFRGREVQPSPTHRVYCARETLVQPEFSARDSINFLWLDLLTNDECGSVHPAFKVRHVTGTEY